MLGRLSHLDNVSIVHYSIQLCLYQRMVRNILPEYSLGTNTLLWLNRETGEVEPIVIDPLDWEPIIDYIMQELSLLKSKIYEIYQIK